MEKECTRCLTIKPLAEFGLRKQSKDGHAACCKACRSIETKARSDVAAESLKKWRENNPDKVKASNASWRAANPEKAKEISSNYKANNADKVAAQKREYYQANKVVLAAKRKAKSYAENKTVLD